MQDHVHIELSHEPPTPEEEAEDAVVCEHEDTAVAQAAAQAVRTSARRATTVRRFSMFAPAPPMQERTSTAGNHPDSHRARRGIKHLKTTWLWIGIFYLVCLWYSAAIFMPPRAEFWTPSQIFWTDGVLETINGTATVCPKASLCSEGWAEIVLLMLSRLTAFMMYTAMGLTFLTKCHGFLHFLANTYVSELFPLEYLPRTHKIQGALFCGLGLLHTVGHLIRWGLRGELGWLGRSVGVSGIVAMVLLVVLIAPMFVGALKSRLAFEVRIWVHKRLTLVLLFAMLVHSTRAFAVAAVFTGLWLADRTFMLLCRTFRLDVVELMLLDGKIEDGVHMLWRNPDGFEPTSGEYVLVQFPWLTEGGDEWHAFSIYLREATAEGHVAVTAERRASKKSRSSSVSPTTRARHTSIDNAGRQQMWEDIHGQILPSVMEDHAGDELLLDLRAEEEDFGTTQVFIMPAGDWTMRVAAAVKEQEGVRRNRTCWIRGPYSSPFSIASDFSQLVLFASGIGITPSLGVLGRYRGNRFGGFRVKFLVWATRSAAMLKFFAPLLSDAQVATVYYTGKPRLTDAEKKAIEAHGMVDGVQKIFVHQRRPNLVEVFARTIKAFEGVAEASQSARGDSARGGVNPVRSVEEIDPALRATWAGLYCGGSKKIENMLETAAKEWGVGWQAELFDW